MPWGHTAVKYTLDLGNAYQRGTKVHKLPRQTFSCGSVREIEVIHGVQHRDYAAIIISGSYISSTDVENKLICLVVNGGSQPFSHRPAHLNTRRCPLCKQTSVPFLWFPTIPGPPTVISAIPWHSRSCGHSGDPLPFPEPFAVSGITRYSWDSWLDPGAS